MSLSFVPVDGTGHIGLPLGGTYKQEKNGRTASLLLASHYPVAAECSICHEPLRLSAVDQAEWRHVAVKKPAGKPAGDAVPAAGTP